MLYIFLGADSFSRREALEELKRRLDDDGMLATNTTVLAAPATTPQEVMAACDTAPFLGQWRLVIVEGLLEAARPGRARRGAKGEASPGLGPWHLLCEYVDRMPPSTVLALVDGEVAAGHPLLVALRPKANVHSFPPLDQRGAAGWVMARARKMGLRLDGRAARLLAELVGNDTWALAGELEKLAAYADGGSIGEAEVRLLVAAARELQIWDLLDAVVEGRGWQVARLVHDLLAQGEAVGSLLKAIEGRYRRLAMARDLLDAGATGAEVGARLGLRGYGLERLLDQAGRQPVPAIRAALGRIVEADAAVKAGLYDEDVSLELLVQELAMASGAGRSVTASRTQRAG